MFRGESHLFDRPLVPSLLRDNIEFQNTKPPEKTITDIEIQEIKSCQASLNSGEIKDRYLRCNYPLNFFNIYKCHEHYNLTDRLSQLHMPVLWLHAANEQIIKKDESQQLFKQLASQRKTFIEINQADHLNISNYIHNPINNWIYNMQAIPISIH